MDYADTLFRPGEAVEAIMKFCRFDKLGALVAVEIGGGNGMANMLAGSSSELNVPVLDGDFMVCLLECLVLPLRTCRAERIPLGGRSLLMYMTKVTEEPTFFPTPWSAETVS
jgi:hypothetical protein